MARRMIVQKQSLVSWLKRPLTLMTLLSFSVGCGKVPTWSELTGGQQAPPQPIQITPPVQPAVTPTPSPSTTQEPPKVNPAEVIAGFQVLKPYEIGDLQLQQLSTLSEGLEAITTINAGGSGQISNAGLANIAKLPAVKEVDLSGTKVDNDGMAALTASQSLQALNLSTTKVSDQGIATLAACPNLRKLNLQGCTITPEGFAAIGKMPVLEEIVLNFTAGLNNATFDLVCNAKTLKSLHICGGVNDAGLASLTKLEVLEELNVSRSGVTGEGFAAITKSGGLRTIKHLGIAVNPINEKGARAINSMKSLEYIDLNEVVMDDQGFSKLVLGLKNLKHVNINEVGGVTSFLPLKSCDDIEVIHAWRTSVNDVALGQLKGHKKLKLLDVGDSKCTQNGVMALKKILPDCKIKFGGIEY